MITEEDTFTVSSGFIGNFKIGDNINHTLGVLTILYCTQRSGSAGDAKDLCKPIIIFIASICEAVLYDLLRVRIQRHTCEGVKNVAKDVMDCIRGKHIDRFEHYIACVKKHGLLDDAGKDIYDSLDELRPLRNRIHLQNEKGQLEPDDGAAFSMKRQQAAEKTLERMLKLMAAKYPRKPSSQGYVGDFQLPWDEHFPA